MYPMNNMPGMAQQNLNPLQSISPQTSQNIPQGIGQGIYPQSPRMGLIALPVASHDEAKAIPTDFRGNMIVMTDLSHKKIYTKVLDPATGSPIFSSYTKDPEPDQSPLVHPEENNTEPPFPAYDAKSEIDSLRAELNKIKQELGIKEETA